MIRLRAMVLILKPLDYIYSHYPLGKEPYHGYKTSRLILLKRGMGLRKRSSLDISRQERRHNLGTILPALGRRTMNISSKLERDLRI